MDVNRLNLSLKLNEVQLIEIREFFLCHLVHIKYTAIPIILSDITQVSEVSWYSWIADINEKEP